MEQWPILISGSSIVVGLLGRDRTQQWQMEKIDIDIYVPHFLLFSVKSSLLELYKTSIWQRYDPSRSGYVAGNFIKDIQTFELMMNDHLSTLQFIGIGMEIPMAFAGLWQTPKDPSNLLVELRRELCTHRA
jgi:hypothetical protein